MLSDVYACIHIESSSAVIRSVLALHSLSISENSLKKIPSFQLHIVIVNAEMKLR